MLCLLAIGYFVPALVICILAIHLKRTICSYLQEPVSDARKGLRLFFWVQIQQPPSQGPPIQPAVLLESRPSPQSPRGVIPSTLSPRGLSPTNHRMQECDHNSHHGSPVNTMVSRTRVKTTQPRPKGAHPTSQHSVCTGVRKPCRHPSPHQ